MLPVSKLELPDGSGLTIPGVRHLKQGNVISTLQIILNTKSQIGPDTLQLYIQIEYSHH